ncbi:MAG: MaoC family dehydratase [Spirochaetaceae bacterium]|nr:MAG: MaoC family dehydratase [Spirochaetaceae bacterium]
MEDSVGLTIDEINIGDTASFWKTITEADIYQFTGIIGNFNPTHVNKDFAAKTKNGQRTVPQMLVAGLVSKILGTQYPGNGTVHVAQDLTFHKPVFINDTVQASLEVTKIDGKKKRVWLDLTCTNQHGELVVSGESEVMPPEVLEGDDE